MPLLRDKKFLYSRIAIIIATAGSILFAYAGARGFLFWHLGFVFCFWFAIGLLNYSEHSSLWYASHHVKPFLFFYGALVGIAVIADQFGLGSHLWFYPAYSGWRMFLAYGALYPFGGLAVLELLYFSARFFGESLIFKELPMIKWLGFFDIFEQILLLFIFAIILANVAGIAKGLVVTMVAIAAIIWVLAMLIKLHFHIHHAEHYTLVVALTVALAEMSNAFPSLSAREWVYIVGPLSDFFNAMFLGLPVWLWFGWFLLVLIPLRLWVVLALQYHAR